MHCPSYERTDGKCANEVALKISRNALDNRVAPDGRCRIPYHAKRDQDQRETDHHAPNLLGFAAAGIEEDRDAENQCKGNQRLYWQEQNHCHDGCAEVRAEEQRQRSMGCQHARNRESCTYQGNCGRALHQHCRKAAAGRGGKLVVGAILHVTLQGGHESAFDARADQANRPQQERDSGGEMCGKDDHSGTSVSGLRLGMATVRTDVKIPFAARNLHIR